MKQQKIAIAEPAALSNAYIAKPEEVGVWDPKALMKVRAYLERYKDRVYSSRCKGDIFDFQGKALDYGHSACHSWIPYDKNRPFLVANCYNPKKNVSIGTDLNNAWIDWLISDEMPLSKYVLNRDNVDLCRNGGVILGFEDGGINYREALWFCKAMRTAWEDPTVVQTWYRLVTEYNIHPLFAYLVSECVKFENKESVVEFPVNSHSSVWYGCKATDDLSNIFNYTLNKRGNALSSQTWLDTGDYAWCNGFELRKIFKEQCKQKITQEDGWGKITVSMNSCPVDVFVEFLSSIQNKYLIPNEKGKLNVANR